MTTGGPSHPSHWSSSWWQRGPLHGDTGSWSPGGSRSPSPCHSGRKAELLWRRAETRGAPPEQDSCCTALSVCYTLPHSCLFLNSSQSFVIQMFGLQEWCVIFWSQDKSKWSSANFLRSTLTHSHPKVFMEMRDVLKSQHFRLNVIQIFMWLENAHVLTI